MLKWVSIGDLLDYSSEGFTVSELVLELLTVGFECQGGPLRNNVAFRRLVHMAHEEGCPNWGQKPSGHYGPCGECAHCKLFENL